MARFCDQRSQMLVNIIIVVLFTTFPCYATDIESNPVTLKLESVSVTSSGLVVHGVDAGPMGKNSTVTLSQSTGLHPHLSIAPNGATSVVWLEPQGAVMFRNYDLSTKAWSVALELFDQAVISTLPAIVAKEATVWVAYESLDSGARVIDVVGIIDSAEPFGMASISTVTGDHNLDLRLMSQAGKTWIVWDVGPTVLGWSVLDPATAVWTYSQELDYDPEQKEDSYLAIRDLVLNP